MQKLKREETGSLSKSERQKLQRLYTQVGGNYGSVHNLVKTSTLTVSKVRQFSHSKPSYTKFTPATRKFNRMKAFAWFKNKIWCIDLAYVDKLVRDNNGVKYLLVRQDLFDWTVDAKGMKTKDSKETVRAFLTMTTKKNQPKRIWVDKGTEFAGEFKKLCKAEGIQIYSTMSETKAAFPERTTRSLKNILYRYMEDNGDNYIHKLTQFVTTLNSWRVCSIDLIPKNVKNSDFFSILYSKPLWELRKPKFKVGDKIRISKYDLPFRKGYKPQFTKEAFEIITISPKKPPTYTINNGIVYNRVGFKCICASISRQYTELSHKLFTRTTESGWSPGGCNFRNIPTTNVPKCYEGKICAFWEEIFKVIRIILSRTWSLFFRYGYCWNHEYFHWRKAQSKQKLNQS